MPFIVYAEDYPDALQRRMATREKHLDALKGLKGVGKVLYAAALLSDTGDMRGSMLVFDFATRAEVDAYLKDEPYIHANVWEKITITACKPAVLHP
jgi:uncharacterized protein YciI